MNSEHIHILLGEMQAKQASDLYLTYGCAPTARVSDQLVQLSDTTLTDADITRYMDQILSADQKDEFDATLELNTALNFNETARFRINVFRQQGHCALVVRRIQVEIPTIDALGLPAVYADVALMKRGLILVAGPTGSGKSTSLAAIVGHRNRFGSGHVVTVEDPIEFIHRHDKCIISQRDIGLDTYSYSLALKNALRQQPDMVVIGEIRDREVMEQAIHFAETSHLCIATIHANNSSQVIERVLNFFPEERHAQILSNLSLNLKAVLSQRLVRNKSGGKSLALEVMLNQGLIRQLIEEGKIRQIRDMIERGNSDGMQTFDQSLVAMYKAGDITAEVAIAEADSAANIRLQISNHDRENGVKPRVTSNMIVNTDVSSGGTGF